MYFIIWLYVLDKRNKQYILVKCSDFPKCVPSLYGHVYLLLQGVSNTNCKIYEIGYIHAFFVHNTLILCYQML